MGGDCGNPDCPNRWALAQLRKQVRALTAGLEHACDETTSESLVRWLDETAVDRE